MLFGLACEGVTDQITLENILCGYFGIADLDQEITRLQPPFDETTQKQKADGLGGGWTALLQHYLNSQRFRDDVLNTRFIVIQVDTDVSERRGFDVPQTDTHQQPLSPEQLINQVIIKLTAIINSGEAGFYEQHADKIIFSISVHSLECWLFAHHKPAPLAHTELSGCYDALKAIEPRLSKNYRCYNNLSSQIFRNRPAIQSVAAKDPSFRVFIRSLASLEPQILAALA
ncbi:hypothetical protein [Methylovulum psychrotolerans]|uniref:Uncharacterized protein n=1 Tax=Methylovulum psychrotolerans TaxID=1704499 RepID=A0A1Z4BZZ4_9GAMM|nr:hypothetical protein [Methylovulum psychrotolerans]ASF46843.1 hypothetical protein CEK71_12570 [Methylovulum psychrotolerans]